MECRETGEFAHRETTNYEQSETFNSEVGFVSLQFSTDGLSYDDVMTAGCGRAEGH